MLGLLTSNFLLLIIAIREEFTKLNPSLYSVKEVVETTNGGRCTELINKNAEMGKTKTQQA